MVRFQTKKPKHLKKKTKKSQKTNGGFDARYNLPNLDTIQEEEYPDSYENIDQLSRNSNDAIYKALELLSNKQNIQEEDIKKLLEFMREMNNNMSKLNNRIIALENKLIADSMNSSKNNKQLPKKSFWPRFQK